MLFLVLNLVAALLFLIVFDLKLLATFPVDPMVLKRLFKNGQASFQSRMMHTFHRVVNYPIRYFEIK